MLSSRSEPDQKALETIELIRAIGSDIVVECGDIAVAGTADRLVAAAIATGLPLRGVLHAAGVVEDATLANITDELLTRDWTPKAFRAWHLHQALQAESEPAAGLVLLVLLGGRFAGLAWAGRLRRCQQLAGRLHLLAARPGPARQLDRVGRLGRGRPRDGRGRKHRQPPSARKRAPTPSRRLLRHNRAYTGYTPIIGVPWLAALAERSKFFELFQAGQTRADQQIPLRTQRVADRRVARAAASACLRAGRPHLASNRRP